MCLIHRECATLHSHRSNTSSPFLEPMREIQIIDRNECMDRSLLQIRLPFASTRDKHIHRFISLSWMTKQAREKTISLSNALQWLAVVCLRHTQRLSFSKRKKPNAGTDDQQFKESTTFKSHSQKSVPNRFTEINEAQREVPMCTIF